MEISRDIVAKLKLWQHKHRRKPLLVMGARQIGKTTVLKEFGEKSFDHFAYFNLEKQVDVHAFFKKNKNPIEILNKLSIDLNETIQPGKSLLILDEIQECKDAIIALKYFAEDMPQLHVIGAGSLLGISIGNDRSFPVGKVEFLDMFPLSFNEYLRAADDRVHHMYEHYRDLEVIEQIPDAFYNPMKQLFKEYLAFGGMPEVAVSFLENRNTEKANYIQEQILRAYQLDFVKHSTKTVSSRIQHIWNSLPSQLAKENKKFLYKVIRSGARAREYEEAVQWLLEAGLLYKVSNISKIGIPLKAYEDLATFKLYAFETGVLFRLSDLYLSAFSDQHSFFTEFKGALAENYVAQCLHKTYGKSLHYWTSKGKAEIDFLISQEGQTIPVEVKSGLNTKAKSLAVYTKAYQPKLRIRISGLNFHQTDDFLNIPLCYSDDIKLFVAKALSR